MSGINYRIGAGRHCWVFYVMCLALPISAAYGQVSIGNPQLRDSPFGSDVTDGLTAPYQVTYVAGEIRNQYSYAVSVPYSISIDGTTVYSGSKTVNGGTLTTVITSASPAPVLAAGGHTISMTSGATTVPRSFTVAPGGNSAPTDISLSASSINENVAANSTVGTLSTTDPDAGNTFTYTLVSGTGSTDNGAFNISGSSLRITASPNYEAKNSYSVRVRTTDQGGLWYEEAFTITINDVNEPAPTFEAPEMRAAGTVVLQWSSVTNHLYTVHHSTNLLNGFTVRQSNIQGTPPMNSYTDTVNGVQMKFWKLTTQE